MAEPLPRQSSFASDTEEAEMSDERRAEIEAAGRALADLANARDREAVRRGDAPRHVALNYEDWREEYDQEATVALDAAARLRDARGDDEAGRCPTCGLHYDEDSAGAECSRLEADLVDIHDALADPDESSPINADWIIERIEALKAAARFPQGEDHEAGIEAALDVWWHCQAPRPEDSMNAAIAAYLSRVSAPKADEKQEA